MPDTKISALSAGGASQATDEYVIARSGSNYKVTGANVAAAATSVGTLSSLTVTGAITLGGDVALSRGAADRLDLATGDSLNLVSGTIKIAGTDVLSSTALGSGVTASSLTSVGTISSGTWQGTAIADTYLAIIGTAGKVSNSATTATNLNTASAIVARDASGNFSAGIITAALTGNASTATTLQTARNINGVSFNGSADITVAAAAGTLTGTTLASNVVNSSLTSVGTLTSATISGNLTVDTNTLAVVASTNRVGVLNATPGSTFHIGSTVATGGLADSNWNANITAASNTQLCVQDGIVQGYVGAIGTFATPGFRIGTYTSHPLQFLAGNNFIGTFSATGSFVLNGSTPRLGINNATPGSPLHINSTVATGGLADSLFVANITSASNTTLAVQDGTVQSYLQATGTVPESRLVSSTNHPLAFGTNNTIRWRINTSGHFVADTDATYDIGASGATRPRDLYLSGNATAGGWVRASAASAGAASTTTIGNGTATTVGAAGGASALPATPLGYIIAHVGTTQVKIPYYNV